MKTIKLYRPVGVKELKLIEASNFQKYPPRLEGQPIFYPVLNFEYAAQIAKDWNTKDEFSGYAGFVTAFEISVGYISRFKIQNVGGKGYDELWVPAEELEEFNNQIIGSIIVEASYYGERYKGKRSENRQM